MKHLFTSLLSSMLWFEEYEVLKKIRTRGEAGPRSLYLQQLFTSIRYILILHLKKRKTKVLYG